MANYFCTDSVEEQVDFLTDKVKDLKTTKLDKAAVVQASGTGTEVVMSQKVVTDALGGKLDKTAVVQVSGTGTDVVMSQKAVTDGFASKTDLNGKLAKPTNPSAESAVTMLADGTVGTKLLSEIGGGGKLYRHIVKANTSGIYIQLEVYRSTRNSITDYSLFNNEICYYHDSETNASGEPIDGIVVATHAYDTSIGISGYVWDSSSGRYKTGLIHFDSITDYVTEV